ncbi:MAG: hypothetical protein IJ736_05560 [Firmicutes bacterium]|nr:hypothetical protein [Bacillota bacterium]
MIKIKTHKNNVFGSYSSKVWIAVILSFILILSVPVLYYSSSLYNEEPLKTQNSALTISSILKTTEESANSALSLLLNNNTKNTILNDPNAVFKEICENIDLHGKYNSKYYLIVFENGDISNINTFNVSDKTYSAAENIFDSKKIISESIKDNFWTEVKNGRKDSFSPVYLYKAAEDNNRSVYIGISADMSVVEVNLSESSQKNEEFLLFSFASNSYALNTAKPDISSSLLESVPSLISGNDMQGSTFSVISSGIWKCDYIKETDDIYFIKFSCISGELFIRLLCIIFSSLSVIFCIIISSYNISLKKSLIVLAAEKLAISQTDADNAKFPVYHFITAAAILALMIFSGEFFFSFIVIPASALSIYISLCKSQNKVYAIIFALMLLVSSAAAAFIKMPSADMLIVMTVSCSVIWLALPRKITVEQKHKKTPPVIPQMPEQKPNGDKAILKEAEKTAAVGKLIAGISHEINTPMGAIKAAADTFNTNLVKSVHKFSEKTKALDEEQTDIVFDILELSMNSVRKMLSTSEIRKAKYKISDELEVLGIENAAKIASSLTRLEICDLDEIKSRIDIFGRDDINELILCAADLFFLITGTNTISMATGKVSKIVFALRAYTTAPGSQKMAEKFDLPGCIDNVITLYSSQFNSSIVINKIYDDDIPEIIGNSESLAQVCTNLIQNSFYAMKEGGTLTIVLKTDETKENVFIEFRDTGCGIPEENLEKIFEPLFTTKPSGEGSGLGLDISKKIIEGHKGTISVESELGKGSTFYIKLPVRQE